MKNSFFFQTSRASAKLVKFVLLLGLIILSALAKAQQKVIQLYPGVAPGSEKWTWEEKENNQNIFHKRVVYNVSRPSLTVFLPDSAVANGTAMIICPGGAWHFLDIENGGYDLARWLNKKGVAAFVMKYRLVHVLTDDPIKESMDKYPYDPHSFKKNGENKAVVALAIADGKAAITYVRRHAAAYGIAPDRIGITGGSSGGTLAAAIAYNHTAENRPDFVVPLYPYVQEVIKLPVPKDAPPMFIVAASDDQAGFHLSSVDLYKAWVLSNHSAELHIYSKGGHGFVMQPQGLPSDAWVDRLTDWLNVQGLLTRKQ
jgi:acetyl esterase/lipase